MPAGTIDGADTDVEMKIGKSGTLDPHMPEIRESATLPCT
jgi:hypothetical protein